MASSASKAEVEESEFPEVGKEVEDGGDETGGEEVG